MISVKLPLKNMRFFCRILVAAVCVFTGSRSFAQSDSSIISTIKQLEIDWHHAYISHDSNVLKNVLADDYINLGRTGGRATKKQTLENFKKDSSFYEYCEPYDFEFRVFENTVIVLCKSREKGISEGKPFQNTYFSYDVFVKRQNKWQCVQAGVGQINKN
jgi:ketosteroid isomerase-like protein